METLPIAHKDCGLAVYLQIDWVYVDQGWKRCCRIQTRAQRFWENWPWFGLAYRYCICGKYCIARRAQNSINCRLFCDRFGQFVDIFHDISCILDAPLWEYLTICDLIAVFRYLGNQLWLCFLDIASRYLRFIAPVRYIPTCCPALIRTILCSKAYGFEPSSKSWYD